MTAYQDAKNNARNEAIEWQANFNNHDYSYGEIAEWQNYFERKAHRYGLVNEFRENGII